MIDPSNFVDTLQGLGITFATGVPDSLLKDVCATITDRFEADRHIIAANEGAAVGIAIGHYVATSEPALVYMQNSGLGNALNPLISLADPEVYAVPMVLMIGWRGEIWEDGTQERDEPQHKKQGKITLDLLRVLNIPYAIFDSNGDTKKILANLIQKSKDRQGPTALVVRKATFAPCVLSGEPEPADLLTREECIHLVIQALSTDTVVVATTGMISRELFELRKAQARGHYLDFLTVGGMGHAISIATGIAVMCPKRTILCLDGDGAVLMHTGALANSAIQSNLLHIVLNNGAHDSVGGQPTRAAEIPLQDIARACGYGYSCLVQQADRIQEAITEAANIKASAFIEIKCRRGNRKNLSRPERSPVENKEHLMSFLKGGMQ